MTGVNFNYGINTNKKRADLLEYERLALAEIYRPAVTATGDFIDISDYITPYSHGVWEPIDRVWTDIDDPKFDQLQPVNLTPGALGVRSEE